MVTDVPYETGEFVAASDPRIATIVDLKKLRATFYLPTTEAMTMRVVQSLFIKLTEVRQTAVGIVEYVGVETIADSGRVQVDVLIDNPEYKYRSGLRCQMVRSSLPPESKYDNINAAERPETSQKN